jgi:hypothetical protein
MDLTITRWAVAAASEAAEIWQAVLCPVIPFRANLF